MWVVFPGAAPTRARFFRFKSRLMTDDLPTLERPTKLTSGQVDSGICETLP